MNVKYSYDALVMQQKPHVAPNDCILAEYPSRINNY